MLHPIRLGITHSHRKPLAFGVVWFPRASAGVGVCPLCGNDVELNSSYTGLRARGNFPATSSDMKRVEEYYSRESCLFRPWGGAYSHAPLVVARHMAKAGPIRNRCAQEQW